MIITGTGTVCVMSFGFSHTYEWTAGPTSGAPCPRPFLCVRVRIMAQPAKRSKLVGYNNFIRHNPMSDRFNVIAFHHLELLCGDAKTTANFLWCAISLSEHLRYCSGIIDASFSSLHA